MTPLDVSTHPTYCNYNPAVLYFCIATLTFVSLFNANQKSAVQWCKYIITLSSYMSVLWNFTEHGGCLERLLAPWWTQIFRQHILCHNVPWWTWRDLWHQYCWKWRWHFACGQNLPLSPFRELSWTNRQAENHSDSGMQRRYRNVKDYSIIQVFSAVTGK